MPSFYCADVHSFLQIDSSTVIGQLTEAGADAGYHQQLHRQTSAWRMQLQMLTTALTEVPHGEREGWGILLEYPIPRRGKRIDAVLLAGATIIVLEFKCGARQYEASAARQVEDYVWS